MRARIPLATWLRCVRTGRVALLMDSQRCLRPPRGIAATFSRRDLVGVVRLSSAPEKDVLKARDHGPARAGMGSRWLP